MGLLFVLEGDETAKGIRVDINIKVHESLLIAAKRKGPGLFPLARRVNDYYLDVLYEKDEISNLKKEFEELLNITNIELIRKLVELCEEAEKRNIGIETIAD